MQRRNRCILMFIEMRLVWLWVMLLVLASECYGCLEHERVALLQLKASSINHQIKYFLPTWVKAWEGETTTDCCKWERVKCNATTGQVIQLSLNSAENYNWDSRDWYLNASLFLPFEELESLDLSYNGLAGWLENEGFEKLGELTSLKSLNLTSNYLEGTIHINDLKGLNNLEQLDISDNQFDGFITHSGLERLYVLGKLELLDLSFNSFNNGIIPSLGVLSSLKTLSLFANRLNESIDIGDLHQPPKNFRQYFSPGKDLKKLLDLPTQRRKAPVVLNFIPTYRSVLPDVPRKKKKSLSPPTATTQTASTSRTDQESTSVPTNQPSTSTPYLIPIPERKRRRRLVKTAEMGRPKPVVEDLLADLPADIDAVPTQSMPPPKPKRTKKAQPKAKVPDVEAEDALPISKLVPSVKSTSAPSKRSTETLPSESTKSKKQKSSSGTTSGSKIQKVPWAPEITLENRPVFVNESAEDVNVGVALSTALLIPGDLNKMAEMSEYENYAFMLQRCVQATQHAHAFSVQSFENRQKLTDAIRDLTALKKENKALNLKMKRLEDQAEAATKARTLAEEKAEAAEAIRSVAESQKKEAEDKATRAEKELEEALAIKQAEINEADERAYKQGMADVADDYKLQVRQACNRGFSLGWMSLAKKVELPDDSPLKRADAIPLPFPPPPPSNQGDGESDSEAEDEDKDDDEALVRKSKDAAEAKSLPSTEQVMDLTLDEEGDEVEEAPKETDPGHLSSDLLLAERSLDKTLAEIDAELAAEKAAEVVPQESAEVVP